MTPVQLRALRVKAGLTQAEAAALVGLGARERWAEYEQPEGKHKIPAARLELFKLKTGGKA